MPKKYRKRPVVIEAVQWTGENHREMYDFLTGDTDGSIQPIGDNFRIDHTIVSGGLVLRTLEGEHLASKGDYVIKGVKGEFYPCKQDIFKMTYDEEEPEYPHVTMGIYKSRIVDPGSKG